SIARAMQGVDVVYHCAAVTRNNRPWAEHYETNVIGTKTVLEAALHAAVGRIVYVSSVVVYGLDAPADGAAIVESAPYVRRIDCWAHYLRSKIEAEKVAFALCRDAGLPVTVVRPGLIYGPGSPRAVGGGLARFGPLQLVIGGGRNALPYTHVDNVVD